LVVNESSNLSAVAINDMEVCFIPKHEIINDLNKNPDFSMDILQQMAHDLKDSDNVIVNMAQKSVKNRLSETLIYIHNRFGSDDNGYLNVLLTREDYANIVGTATESAIRILSKFKKDGLISTVGKHIKIENLEELKRVE